VIEVILSLIIFVHIVMAVASNIYLF